VALFLIHAPARFVVLALSASSALAALPLPALGLALSLPREGTG
jgi:hypothetical protein